MKKSMILLGMLSIGYAYAQEERVGINTESPAATLNVKTKNDTKSPKSLELENEAGTKLMTVLNNGNVGVGTDTPAEKLSVLGGRISVRNGSITSYLENVALRFNRPYSSYIGNEDVNGRLIFSTGGEVSTNGRMTIWENGKVSIGTSTAYGHFNVAGVSNKGVIRVLSKDANSESTIGYSIFGDFSSAWVTGTSPIYANSYIIRRNDENPKMLINSRGLVGINTTEPTHILHIVADANPLKLEGLQADNNADKVLVTGADGVVKTIAKSALTGGNSTATAVKLPTTNSATCSDTTIGTINFGEITINGIKTTAFGFCMKNSANEYVWGYMFGGGNFTTGNATFGGGL